MIEDAAPATDLAIRPYRDDDEAEVLDLVRGSLGGGPAGERPPEYFRWKHLENVFGRSFMIVAESEGRIIGFRALMRWRFEVDGRTFEAVRPVDTVTHPDFRGRGVFSRLTRTALDLLHEDVDLVFNTPNPNSLPGYVKMGWQVVGQVPVWIRLSHPARFVAWKLRRGRSEGAGPSERPSVVAPTAAEALSDATRVTDLIDRSTVASGRFSTPKSVDYLRWRYGSAPLLGYHAVTLERRGELAGMCFFRLRAEGPLWGASIADLLVAPGDLDTARSLLVAARRAADVSYLAATFPSATTAARAYRRLTTLRAPRGLTLVANPLTADLRPDPLDLSSWALSTGDVEVF
jgi:GNAT superfamily N-acetyltransferase